MHIILMLIHEEEHSHAEAESITIMVTAHKNSTLWMKENQVDS